MVVVMCVLGVGDVCVKMVDVKMVYDVYVLMYDVFDGGGVVCVLGLDVLRADAFARCEGDVLEFVVGIGFNLCVYDVNRVKMYMVIDLLLGMLVWVKVWVEMLVLGEKARFEEADATALSFDDGLFDVVVDMFSLCVIEDLLVVL